MNESLFSRDHTATLEAPGVRSIRRARRAESSTPAPTSPRLGRRTRRLGILAGAVLFTFIASRLWSDHWASWVPDLNGDGQLTQDEANQESARIAANIEAQRRAVQNDPFLTCVRHHESDRGAAPVHQRVRRPEPDQLGVRRLPVHRQHLAHRVGPVPARPATPVPPRRRGTCRTPSRCGCTTMAAEVPGTAVDVDRARQWLLSRPVEKRERTARGRSVPVFSGACRP